MLHGSLHVRGSRRTKTCYRAAVGKRDSAVSIDANHILNDALVGTLASLAVLIAYIAFAGSLEQDVGKHAGGCGLQVIL